MSVPEFRYAVSGERIDLTQVQQQWEAWGAHDADTSSSSCSRKSETFEQTLKLAQDGRTLYDVLRFLVSPVIGHPVLAIDCLITDGSGELVSLQHTTKLKSPLGLSAGATSGSVHLAVPGATTETSEVATRSRSASLVRTGSTGSNTSFRRTGSVASGGSYVDTGEPILIVVNTKFYDVDNLNDFHCTDPKRTDVNETKERWGWRKRPHTHISFLMGLSWEMSNVDEQERLFLYKLYDRVFRKLQPSFLLFCSRLSVGYNPQEPRNGETNGSESSDVATAGDPTKDSPTTRGRFLLGSIKYGDICGAYLALYENLRCTDFLSTRKDQLQADADEFKAQSSGSSHSSIQPGNGENHDSKNGSDAHAYAISRCNPNYCWENMSPLFTAIYSICDMGFLNLLMGQDETVDLEMVNENDQTALQAASEEGSLDVVKALLAHKANINGTYRKTGEPEDTPLLIAIIAGHFDIVKTLLACYEDRRNQNAGLCVELDPELLEYALNHATELLDGAKPATVTKRRAILQSLRDFISNES